MTELEKETMMMIGSEGDSDSGRVSVFFMFVLSQTILKTWLERKEKRDQDGLSPMMGCIVRCRICLGLEIEIEKR